MSLYVNCIHHRPNPALPQFAGTCAVEAIKGGFNHKTCEACKDPRKTPDPKYVQITEGKHPVRRNPTPEQIAAVKRLRHEKNKQWGPSKWKILEDKTDPDQHWLNSFVAGLPCGECRQEATKYIAANPVDWEACKSDPAYWMRYSWTWHNSVNAYLDARYPGKHPQFSWEALSQIRRVASRILSLRAGSETK